MSKTVVPTCLNCAYRKGSGYEHSKCMLSGYYCTTERMYPAICGRNYENWKQREPGVIKAFFMKFVKESK